MSVDEEKEVIGNLKVSLEAAKALTGIYQEFHQKSEAKKEDETDEEKEEEEEREEEKQQKEKKKDLMQLIDYDDDSDFNWKQSIWEDQSLLHYFTKQWNKVSFWNAFEAVLIYGFNKLDVQVNPAVYVENPSNL